MSAATAPEPSSTNATSSNGQQAANLELNPTAAEVYDNCFPPNTPLAASTTSFLLGSLFSIGLWFFVANSHIIPALFKGSWASVAFNQPLVQLPFFIGAWAFFHWAEFAVTAGWNREKCSSHSFLLDNGKEYHIAHTFALVEFLVTWYFFPTSHQWAFITPIGVLMVIAGQVLRSAAMIHASTNFSHVVAHQHRQGHRLVTGGVYSWSRHPSYVGFFYWGIGTQLALQNKISFIGYSIVLWRFFYRRIIYEERALVRFFGDDYKTYRERVPTRIPFIR
ncbi:Protein-S-isoprenylcysteine O-methyltransferase; AltName: Full=Farnesyl cysteine carboxyl methyltransferase; Short=FCMT; AltName: Full=Isoprenylcysteine carboxylmethyltransferase; AltName: Full=Prenylated protein carboxyl methyltransferase; Short=PPMT; AltName: Full=Prenylcysteine carboxyl methyltransferase; Short=pcCMT [Serendipita indica DSM 11827]|uniref:Protein-S-isoprenylcysteine O-methyltransferase n=1 Tax=Serendipita indica (strain DSM 11827) TaxID=1109443 RepID=G4TGP7_SERID|nr:Protein-S-isoprenylcysteine O-methyltransferase; AltName: Full=Farnesyl cysteine carboxyl methyltransferase; Short=FCMT; AltName: Full=Isoprenylcysteine carboxylmethyltransferase; AltName: Full=Prenylated protein carboxyl methyltransferase; Short=PPMT; AltName: Full=Prenylcysteine carboxyl methyltransferase; Short=pcCMT [Serendipita indica DSM 11827]CCA70485.1 related to STE14-farnesyl cysteine carboxyl-methyltransferase [Serendipita indica DSM 11827]